MGFAKLDRHALHVYLWKQSDRRNTVQVKGTELAELLGVSMFTISRVMKELGQQGRVRVLGRAKFDIATYLVQDPAGFEPD